MLGVKRNSKVFTFADANGGMGGATYSSSSKVKEKNRGFNLEEKGGKSGGIWGYNSLDIQSYLVRTRIDV